MVKEPKITIKFFLHERLKPENITGVDHFPIYARVTFLRRNTQLPMLDYVGEEIYSDPRLFRRFEDDYEKFGEFANQQWWDEGWIDILSKGLILRKTIEWFFQQEGGTIDMKEVIQSFRVFEKNTWVQLRSQAIKILSILIKNERLVHPSALIYKTELNEYERNFLELFTAYSGFMSFSWEKIRQERFWLKRGYTAHPSTFGTVFSWRFEGERESFNKYLHEANPLEIKKHAQIGGGLFKEFVEMFPPLPGKESRYISIANDLISNNTIKKSSS